MGICGVAAPNFPTFTHLDEWLCVKVFAVVGVCAAQCNIASFAFGIWVVWQYGKQHGMKVGS